MKYLGLYEEFSQNAELGSIKKYFEKKPYQGQEKIATYLDSGKVTVVAGIASRDIFTRERIHRDSYGQTDGEYSWPDTLSYYVRKYNLRLPRDFEEHVLQKLEKRSEKL